MSKVILFFFLNEKLPKNSSNGDQQTHGKVFLYFQSLSRSAQANNKFYKTQISKEPSWIKVLTSTTTASKYIPKRLRICINWNHPFQTQTYLVKLLLNVNIVKQDLLNKKQLLKILWSEVWKGGFLLMLILGLLGMYFDAAVAYVTNSLLLLRLAVAVLWCTNIGFL